MLTAGSLKDKVIILAPVADRDIYGSQITVYIDIKTVWANVVYRKGAQVLTAGEVWMSNEVGVTMRYNNIVNERCRLKWDDKIFQINSLNRSKSDGSMVIIASKIDDGSNIEEENK